MRAHTVRHGGGGHRLGKMLTPVKADGKSLYDFCNFPVRVKFKARSFLTFHACRIRKKVRVCSGFKRGKEGATK